MSQCMSSRQELRAHTQSKICLFFEESCHQFCGTRAHRDFIPTKFCQAIPNLKGTSILLYRRGGQIFVKSETCQVNLISLWSLFDLWSRHVINTLWSTNIVLVSSAPVIIKYLKIWRKQLLSRFLVEENKFCQLSTLYIRALRWTTSTVLQVFSAYGLGFFICITITKNVLCFSLSH